MQTVYITTLSVYEKQYERCRRLLNILSANQLEYRIIDVSQINDAETQAIKRTKGNMQFPIIRKENGDIEEFTLFTDLDPWELLE